MSPTTHAVIIGAGTHLTRHLPNARLVRVNPTHPQTPPDLGERALPVPYGADRLLDALNGDPRTPRVQE
ncbi:hypothetical protein ABZ568_26070 [Streptomyces olindensis]|uniref:Uncharacterized protein n=1 Tax=Streptomyces olindensis TaxID=358823 RepID=A0ABV2Y0L8_9ACTN